MKNDPYEGISHALAGPRVEKAVISTSWVSNPVTAVDGSPCPFIKEGMIESLQVVVGNTPGWVQYGHQLKRLRPQQKTLQEMKGFWPGIRIFMEKFCGRRVLF